MSKPINVEAQRIAKIIDDTEGKCKKVTSFSAAADSVTTVS
jgi:hypothetical protein